MLGVHGVRGGGEPARLLQRRGAARPRPGPAGPLRGVRRRPGGPAGSGGRAPPGRLALPPERRDQEEEEEQRRESRRAARGPRGRAARPVDLRDGLSGEQSAGAVMKMKMDTVFICCPRLFVGSYDDVTER